MLSNTKFILNNEFVETEINPSTITLDLIRSLKLTGTKEGCKEGDCGACTVLSGELYDDEVIYKSINSCLIPVQNISGKHIVTIEGLNSDSSENNLNPIQHAFVYEGASQCGFCTPGFIVSLTGYFLNDGKLSYNNVIDSLDGNICRCTGHNSIIRAAERVSAGLKDANLSSNGAPETRLKYLADKKIIPEYFLTIKNRLKDLEMKSVVSTGNNGKVKYFIGGGTDLFVQRPDEMLSASVKFLENKKSLKGIKISDGYCHIVSASTVTDLLESEIINKIFPNINYFAELFGSTPIRNSATVGGNLNNASPIGDMTAFFLALDSNVILSDGENQRELPLNKFYISYKNTERKSGEYLESINFKIPEGNYFFNFEKVSKRTYLDIASVNSAVLLTIENETIKDINISAGGVAAVPMYLSETCSFLKGKDLNIGNLDQAVSISQSEISPISDARGSAVYKRLLLKRLIYTHFITLFPKLFSIKELV